MRTTAAIVVAALICLGCEREAPPAPAPTTQPAVDPLAALNLPKTADDLARQQAQGIIDQAKAQTAAAGSPDQQIRTRARITLDGFGPKLTDQQRAELRAIAGN